VDDRLPGVAVAVAQIRHKGGVTVGVRVEGDGTSLAYLPDHSLLTTDGDDEEAAHAIAQGVDVLLHGGQYVTAESRVAVEYGHATIEAAMDFADRCEVGRLVVVHHAPNRADEALRGFEATFVRTPGGRPVTFARQDEALEVKVTSPLE
jgi:ribonuclease BN (tRNA processing enzyme)